ncbi:phosphoadenosine phosphosulfate reductase [Corynebacterium striatum]|uniref:phosphoadenosine phosphosulfate reductase n=1 Tax=Corynebacterium striatum TaxID=43770 RepID=UPI000D76982D|nr:phosphoadenosine phosphosulfate reductase [Corynebacterium striatum]PXY04617.1 hypothetical protein CKF53_09315 [Corynebacterium striatum]
MRKWDLAGINPGPVRKKSGEGLAPAVESSAHMRQKLAEEGRPVLVAFSRGKDSIAAMIALMAAGVEVIPVHLWRVPGLRFEEESLKKFEEFFGMEILHLPHRDFWNHLEEQVHTAPWMASIYEAGGITTIKFPEFWAMVCESLGLDDDTWVCDGVRAADSPMRRLAMVTHGPWTSKIEKIDGEPFKTRIAHVVWDWKIADIRRCIAKNDVELPIDYDLFGRTFDGLDYRFIKPISEKLPDDFELIRRWFPGVDLEMMRYEHL